MTELALTSGNYEEVLSKLELPEAERGFLVAAIRRTQTEEKAIALKLEEVTAVIKMVTDNRMTLDGKPLEIYEEALKQAGYYSLEVKNVLES